MSRSGGFASPVYSRATLENVAIDFPIERQRLSTLARPDGSKFGNQTSALSQRADSCFPPWLVQVGANLARH